MEALEIRVVTADARLKKALLERFARGGFALADSDGTFEELERGNLVVTTPADCSPVAAKTLTRAGVIVVVLAPVTREQERAAYAQVGARYVPMAMDTGPLFDALRETVAGMRAAG